MATVKEVKEQIVGDYKTQTRIRVRRRCRWHYDAAYKRIDGTFLKSQKGQPFPQRLA